MRCLALILALCLLSGGCVKSVKGGAFMGPGGFFDVQLPDKTSGVTDHEISVHVQSGENVQHSGQWATDRVQDEGLQNQTGKRRP